MLRSPFTSHVNDNTWAARCGVPCSTQPYFYHTPPDSGHGSSLSVCVADWGPQGKDHNSVILPVTGGVRALADQCWSSPRTRLRRGARLCVRRWVHTSWVRGIWRLSCQVPKWGVPIPPPPSRAAFRAPLNVTSAWCLELPWCSPLRTDGIIHFSILHAQGCTTSLWELGKGCPCLTTLRFHLSNIPERPILECDTSLPSAGRPLKFIGKLRPLRGASLGSAHPGQAHVVTLAGPHACPHTRG